MAYLWLFLHGKKNCNQLITVTKKIIASVETLITKVTVVMLVNKVVSNLRKSP